MSRILIALLALLALTATLPATAPAASIRQIIDDCADDGRLQGKYTRSELREARKNLPSDVMEYSDCADVLRRAELGDGGSAGGSGGSGGGGSFGGTAGSGGAGGTLTPANDAERAALAKAQAQGAAPVDIDGRKIVPGAAGFSPDATRNEMPATLLFAVIALALLGLGGFAYSLRDRLPDLVGLIPRRNH